MGAVVSCFQAIGACIMTVINAIAGVIMAIINGIVAVLKAIVSFLTCKYTRIGHSWEKFGKTNILVRTGGYCGSKRRRGGGVSTV